jgi:hypothetical protein
MSDIYTPDPDRMIVNCAIGNVQAWKAAENDAAVALSFYASLDRYAHGLKSYVSSTLNLKIADARSVAASLLMAADHAEKLAAKEATNG